MRHPGMERLQAFEAGELMGRARQRTAEHVAGCFECRSTISWMEDVRSAARAQVAEPPADAWARIAARVQARDAMLLPVEPLQAPRVPVVSRALRVALIALLVAGAAAAALPREWIGAAVDAVVPAAWRGGDTDLVASAPHAENDDTPPVTLFVEPAAGALRVAMERPHQAVTLHVQFVDAVEMQVRASGGAAGAIFRTSPGRVDIVGADSGAVVLALPNTVGNVRIEVDGQAFLLRERGQIRVLAPTADTIGSEYILPVRGAGRRQE